MTYRRRTGGEHPATNRQQPTRNDSNRQGHRRNRSTAAGHRWRCLRSHSRGQGWPVQRTFRNLGCVNGPGGWVMRRSPPMTTLADRLLPDQLWQRIQPLLPPPPSHVRGGAPRTVPDRACMAAIIFIARTSTPWALLPVGEFGCGGVTTCWRRFSEWAAAGVFERLQELLLDELGEAGALDWSRISVDSVSLRATRGDLCGKPGRPGQGRVPSCTWPLRHRAAVGRRSARSPGWWRAGGCASAMTAAPSGSSPSRCWPARGWATTGCLMSPRRTHGHPDLVVGPGADLTKARGD